MVPPIYLLIYLGKGSLSVGALLGGAHGTRGSMLGSASLLFLFFNRRRCCAGKSSSQRLPFAQAEAQAQARPALFLKIEREHAVGLRLPVMPSPPGLLFSHVRGHTQRRPSSSPVYLVSLSLKPAWHQSHVPITRLLSHRGPAGSSRCRLPSCPAQPVLCV